MTECEIVQDLLPLYKDEVVSASSIAMIEEHLITCDSCKNELVKLQGEVKVVLKPEQKEEISSFRLFRKKLLRRNVIVACTSVVAALALILGVYLYLDRARTIIPYSDDLIVAVNTYPDHGILDVVSSVKPQGWNVSGTIVNENGENIKLVFMNFTESIISRWQNNHNGDIEYRFQVVQPMAVVQLDLEENSETYKNFGSFDRCEVYYVNEADINPESDYQRLRYEGNLVWSGSLEDSYQIAWKTYALENATEQQRAERMMYISLYTNGTMSFAPAMVSSTVPPPQCTYAIEGNEMVFRAIIKTARDRDFHKLEDGDIVARFTIIDDDTLMFHSSEILLYAEPNGRYVAVYPDEQAPGIPVFDLTNSGELTASAQYISNFWLYTNSKRISVSVSGDIVDDTAYITLYDTDTMNDIMQMRISPDKRDGAFTNLTSARIYLVVATGLDGCEITLSD